MNLPVLGENSQVTQSSSQSSGVLTSNRLIRNTYLLLSATLLFTAATAGISMLLNMPPLNFLLTIVLYFFFLFMVSANRNSAWGLMWVFALTGFMGLTLGPVLNAYITFLSNGSQIVATAFGGTAAIFLGLSAYAIVSRKDFSFLGGFLAVGILVAFLAGLASFVFAMPILHLAVSASFILLMSGMILYETSRLVHQKEGNYIMATLSLYIALYNLFLSLLHILGALAGGRD